MKERLIDGVIAKMSGGLSPQQLFALRRALDDELAEFDVTSAPKGVEKARKANDDLAAQFISAKRIEGCSEKTLNYYEKYYSCIP